MAHLCQKMVSPLLHLLQVLDCKHVFMMESYFSLHCHHPQDFPIKNAGLLYLGGSHGSTASGKAFGWGTGDGFEWIQTRSQTSETETKGESTGQTEGQTGSQKKMLRSQPRKPRRKPPLRKKVLERLKNLLPMTRPHPRNALQLPVLQTRNVTPSQFWRSLRPKSLSSRFRRATMPGIASMASSGMAMSNTMWLFCNQLNCLWINAGTTTVRQHSAKWFLLKYQWKEYFCPCATQHPAFTPLSWSAQKASRRKRWMTLLLPSGSNELQSKQLEQLWHLRFHCDDMFTSFSKCHGTHRNPRLHFVMSSCVQRALCKPLTVWRLDHLWYSMIMFLDLVFFGADAQVLLYTVFPCFQQRVRMRCWKQPVSFKLK